MARLAGAVAPLMVIGKQFAWAHFPKTGGDATYHLFRLVPRLVRYADKPASPGKHARFPAREAEIRGKILVMNIRRLPSWVLSYAHHKARDQHGTSSPPDDAIKEILAEVLVDGKLRRFTGDGRFAVDHWLRTEYLATDVLDFVTGITRVSERTRRRILNVGRVNARSYDHDWDRWFTPEEISQLYLRNPLWASIERQVYGRLPTEV